MPRVQFAIGLIACLSLMSCKGARAKKASVMVDPSNSRSDDLTKIDRPDIVQPDRGPRGRSGDPSTEQPRDDSSVTETTGLTSAQLQAGRSLIGNWTGIRDQLDAAGVWRIGTSGTNSSAGNGRSDATRSTPRTPPLETPTASNNTNLGSTPGDTLESDRPMRSTTVTNRQTRTGGPQTTNGEQREAARTGTTINEPRRPFGSNVIYGTEYYNSDYSKPYIVNAPQTIYTGPAVPRTNDSTYTVDQTYNTSDQRADYGNSANAPSTFSQPSRVGSGPSSIPTLNSGNGTTPTLNPSTSGTSNDGAGKPGTGEFTGDPFGFED